MVEGDLNNGAVLGELEENGEELRLQRYTFWVLGVEDEVIEGVGREE